MGPVRRDEEVGHIIDSNGINGFHPSNGMKNGFVSTNGYNSRLEMKPTARILPNVLAHIHNTPMIKLNRIPQAEGVECEIFAKCELFGPGGSHKDRIALRMIEEAERDGRLYPGATIIEPTSGNTGIGVAMVAAVKGYACILVMPDKMSAEKHETMTALGAKVVRTPKGVLHTDVAKQIQKETPNSMILDQYGNQSNPMAHYHHTAEEIIDQCEGRIDAIVMGVGTGGVVSGVGKKIKEKLPECTVVGVDPEGSLMALPESMNKSDTNFWEVEGIGHDWLPDVLDRSVIDKWVKCTDKETFNMARRMIKDEGLLVGGSCGSALVGAIKAAKELGLGKGKRVVIILPDSVRNYMSKFLSDQWMLERAFLDDPEPTKAYSWWKNPISSISPSMPPTTTRETTVGEALVLMKKEQVQHIPVVCPEGYVQGVISVGQLVKNLTTKVITKNTLVGEIIFSQYKRVTESDSLGKLNYILQAVPFAVVIEPITSVNAQGKTVVQERLKGLVTQMDLAEIALL